MVDFIMAFIDLYANKKSEYKREVEHIYTLTNETMTDFMEILTNVKNGLGNSDMIYSEALKEMLSFSDTTSFKRIEIKSKILCNENIDKLEGDDKLFVFSVIGILQGGFHRRVLNKISEDEYDFGKIKLEYENLSRSVDNLKLNELTTEPYHTIKDILKRNDESRKMFNDPTAELIKDIAFQISEIKKSWVLCTHSYNNILKKGG